MAGMRFLFCASAITFLTAGAAQADQAAASGEVGDGEIVVTAQRRNERLLDVPVAVSQVSGDSLQAAGIADIQQIKLAVPGANVRFSAGYSQPYIRGVGSSAKTPLNEPPIATYVDEVYIASETSLAGFTNIKSVEVVKGPQGTLFGRNATGGLFNITTLDPSFTPTGNAHIGYANYQTINGDAYFATGLSDKVAAVTGPH